jgi:hypothetical protein
MPLPGRIAILLHARDRDAEQRSYIAWELAACWRAAGVAVELVRGAAQVPDADLLLPHLDLTVTPPEYAALLDAHPCAVNRGVRDVSKRRISAQLLRPGDGWDGPVIVKTDRNFGGVPETRFLEPEVEPARELATASALRPGRYRVFASLSEVPAAVRANPALVLERFLPEHDGELYCVRSYTFFGDAEVCWKKRGRRPVVKNRDLVDRVRVEPHPAMREARRRLRFDYGKFDYVERDGGAVLLDANPTPSYGAGAGGPGRAERNAALARGALAWFAACTGT